MNRFIRIEDTDIMLIDGDRGINYPSKNEFYNSEYCLFLDAGNITNEGFDFSEAHFITKEKDELLRNGKLQRNDIVMMTRGSVGNVALYDETVPYDNVRINSGMVIIRCKKEFKPLQLYYLLKSNFVQKQILDMLSGSVQKQLPVSIINKIQLLNNSINVDVVYTIDKKIKNNIKINIELESMAKTIYDYWFLQFEFPDENGKPYKSSGGKMVWNKELQREIPEEWRNGTLGDFGEIVAGGTPSTEHPEYYVKNGIAWITPNDMSNSSNKYITHGERDISESGLRNSSAKLMPKGTVLLTSRAPIGYIGIAVNEVCTNQGFKSIVPNEKFGSEFIYYTIQQMVKYLKSLGTGSTFTEISKKVVEQVKIVLPKETVVKKFEKLILEVSVKREILEKENKELTSLRDFLLPLLMNGQIGFKN